MTTPTPSCLNCAFRLGNLDPISAQAYTGTPHSDIDICTNFDTVLGDMDEAAGQIRPEDAERVAGQCVAYTANTTDPADRKAVARTVADRALVQGAVGSSGGPIHLTHGIEVGVPGDDGSVKPNCNLCIYWVRPNEMDEQEIPELGTAGFCVARGTYQKSTPGSMSMVASQCLTFTLPDGGVHAASADARQYRQTLLESAGFAPHLAPLLEETLIGIAHRTLEDPAPAKDTEPEVTDADRAEGIIGYRRFTSDDGKKSVELPIFDPEFFDETERAKIPVAGSEGSPETYLDHANLGYRVAVAWVLGETPALNGPAGTGKTMLFQWLAYELGLPFERVSITASSSVDDLAGYMELHGSNTEFVLGRIPKAWAKPCIMVLDEPNAGPPEVWQFIRPITDSAKQLVLDANHGQKIDRHPRSYLGMAMNPAWDWRNTGVAPLSDADGSRLLHVAVGYPSADDERKIITDHCANDGITVDKPHLDALIQVAKRLRELAENQTLQVSWGVRQQIQVARLLPYFEFQDAFRMAVTDSLEPSQAELILAEVNLVTASLRKRKRAKR